MEKEEIEGYSIAEAVAEARRCLNCPKPLCRTGCPIENDIPAFNHAVSLGNFGDAFSIISQRSNLPAICGRVCPHENQCEGHCVLNKAGKAIHIGKIERFVADFEADAKLAKDNKIQKIEGKVAVIGSGPAGLTVAGDLARKGYEVVVYESESEPGGVLLYGIPEFRLPKDVVRRTTKKIEELGVKYITNTVIGRDLTVDELFKDGFDAVFIGTGTALAKSLDLPGKDLTGVIQSNYFLRMVRLYQDGNVEKTEVPVEEGDNVVVIGAGNVAMDACRTAVRMKAASVTVAYRKTEEFMRAAKAEYEGAIKDGVSFKWEHAPVEFVGENGRVTGLKCQTPEGEVVLPANKILLAIGSRPAARILSTTEGIDADESGYVITRQRPYGMSTRRGIFAGGDVVHKPATVVLAMREAKKVAVGISEFIEAKKLLGE
ncbi:NAD(P)-dependent oxidoreductase [Treponema zioleckii]|uniref:NAD(P)-dependent oxidoreductase n=1 Tax=Treponema zioleckii TaxID=331680 RepID=UPI00168B3E93|nr:NAD(P)-dependent oxidoreductase [Treponema zioleckii]